MRGDRRVDCWGENLYGQLGDVPNLGTEEPLLEPQPVEGLPLLTP